MASLISDTTLAIVTGHFVRHFETFGVFQPIIVNKEPQKVIAQTNDSIYPGYGNESNISNITYVPVSGVFPAIVVVERGQKLTRFPETESRIPNGATKIKILKDARDYINNGKTESIVMNDITFNVVTSNGFQNYLGLVYYYFILEQTN